MSVPALVGTAKDHSLLWSDDDRRRWQAEGPLLDGWGAHHATVDTRDGTVCAAANHWVYGATILDHLTRWDDSGETWIAVNESVAAEPAAR